MLKKSKNVVFFAILDGEFMKICGIEISSEEKIVFPNDNITKLEIAKYYEKIATKMLPFLNERLLSVIRCHSDIEREKFFKKHPTTEGDYVHKFLVGDDEFFYVKTKKEIVFQAQMGTIEFHTWGSKVKSLDRPDLMIFDLDPSEDVGLEQLRDGVLKLKSVLSQLGLSTFLKTSGGKGYHVAVPFSKSKNWETFGEFSKQVALVLESKYPKMFTSNIRKNDRKGRIFVDYLRNKKGATCVAPYSLRARSTAPISLPIEWAELDKISPNEVNIKNIDKFLNNPEPWANIFNENQILK